MQPNNNNPKFDTDLELCSEPELHNLILVELTPDVQHAQNHGVHQQLTTTVNTEPQYSLQLFANLSSSLLTLIHNTFVMVIFMYHMLPSMYVCHLHLLTYSAHFIVAI